jgi:hypothetical protein
MTLSSLTTLDSAEAVLRACFNGELPLSEMGSHFIDMADEVIRKSAELIECPVKHSFVPGHYCRQITMPKGAVVVSKKHQTWHPYTVTKGRVSVILETSTGLRLQNINVPEGAHFTAITAPGTRRLILCREETTWTTFHPTELTDLEEIEKLLIESPVKILEV